jgi:hypothetical protein
MNLQHVNVKLFAKDPEKVDDKSDLEPLIPIFHSWIEGKVFEELLLDVGDYRHVPEGPGVILIGLQADYSVDNNGGRLGVRYNRKAAFDGDTQECLRQATRAACVAFQKLESDPRMGGKLAFNGREIEIFVNDRLVAPNTEATREAHRAEFQKFFAELLAGAEVSFAYDTDPRRLFGLTAKSSRLFTVSEMLQNLAKS